MTDDRSLERAARSFIEVGPTQAPEAAVEAALLRIQTTSQVRDWFPWRIPHMSTPLRLALLVGGAVLAIAGVGLLTTGGPGPGPAPSPTPSSSPSASPSPSAARAQPLPERLRGDWQANAATAIPGVAGAGEHIQLSLDWDGGERAWIQRSDGSWVVMSDSVEASDGEIRLVSTEVAGGCAIGDEARYAWERPGDGEFLTLTRIDDACEARAAALARTWVHSLSAVTDGGPGVIPWSGRWIQATLPSMRFGLSGPADVADLQTFDDADPNVAFTVFRNPMGLNDPCAAQGTTARAIEPTTDAFVDYVRGLPGATVTTEAVTVGGLPAVHLTVDMAPVASCSLVDIAAFHAARASDAGVWTLQADGSHSLWIVQDGPDTLLFWYEGEGITPADEQAVIDSIAFLDDLPTP